MSKARNWWWFIDRIGDYESHMHAITHTICHERTEYQEVGIVNSIVYGKILVLDGDMQSSQYDEFIYHESLVHPAMIAHPNPEKVLVLGGGEGATLREVLRHKTVKKAVMVDIDKRLVELCREFLPEYSAGAFDDPRTEVVFADVLEWMTTCDEKFDVIVGDLTDPLPQTPAYGLYSMPFFELLKRRLSEGGIFVTQSSRISFVDMYLHNVLYKTMTEAFPILRTACAHIPGFDVPWSFTSASYEIDPIKLNREEIDSRISSRLISELKYYDGETHTGLFALPLHVRKARREFLEDPKFPEGKSSPVFII